MHFFHYPKALPKPIHQLSHQGSGESSIREAGGHDYAFGNKRVEANAHIPLDFLTWRLEEVCPGAW